METQTIEDVKKVILTQLPRLMETEPDIRDFILRVTRDHYAGKQETESRFDRIMDELKRDREADMRKWEAQEQRWAAWEKKWDEERKAQDKKWEAQDEKWEENQKVINQMLADISLQNRKYDSTIGALGARWGLHSESAFRNGLRAILERSFGVTVERYEDYDHEGKVFGRPEQIEMDVIVHNGTLILCEIKSSMSKSDLYSFWRKKNFYEEKHGRKASRAMVISPMIDDRAKSAAKDLGIEVYGYAEDVKT
jgi:hypothetical protein